MARTMPLPVRLSPHIRLMIEEAARLEGQSLSNFLEQAGKQAAEKILDRAKAREVLQKLG